MSAAESDSVRVARRISASPERVFAAWIDPVLLRRWLAPIAETDPRAGGYFRLEVSKPEGAHVVTGEYRELMPGRRLVMTWVYEGPMAPSGKVTTLVTVEFRDEGPSTQINLQHDHLASGYRDVIQKGAWTKALDELESVLSS